jgi:hypothetical protein
MPAIHASMQALEFTCPKSQEHKVYGGVVSKELLPEEQVRQRMYRLECGHCNWKGNLPGTVAIRVFPVLVEMMDYVLWGGKTLK